MDVHKCDVEGAPTKVIDENPSHVLQPNAIGQGNGRRLIENLEHVKACDSPSLFCRCSPYIIKVRRYSNDGIRNRLAQINLYVLFYML